MKKTGFNKKLIMIAIFLCGILLVGVGAGVAFGEYSQLEYGGVKNLCAGKMKEITLEQKISTGKKAGKTILYNHYGNECVIEEDKKVPEGIVSYEVLYNPDYIIPELEYHKIADDEYSDNTTDECDAMVYISFHEMKDDMELFMEVKDEILTDLKNGKISSYPYNPIEKVVVKVNPKTMKYIEDRM